VVNFDLTPRSLRSSWKDLAVNQGSQSEIMVSGSPKRL